MHVHISRAMELRFITTDWQEVITTGAKLKATSLIAWLITLSTEKHHPNPLHQYGSMAGPGLDPVWLDLDWIRYGWIWTESSMADLGLMAGPWTRYGWTLDQIWLDQIYQGWTRRYEGHFDP